MRERERKGLGFGRGVGARERDRRDLGLLSRNRFRLWCSVLCGPHHDVCISSMSSILFSRSFYGIRPKMSYIPNSSGPHYRKQCLMNFDH
jgi:hypothetical protein